MRLPSQEQAVAVFALFAYACIAIIGLTHSYQQQSKPDEQQEGANNSTTAGQDQAATDDYQQSTSEQAPYWYRFLTGPVASDWALVIIGTAAAFIALRTLGTIRKQTDGVLVQARASIKAARAADITAQSALLAQRSWVDISHSSPPGLIIGSDIRYHFVVKNHGKTPARVTPLHDFLSLGHTDDDLPAIPPYGRPPSEAPHMILMPNETIGVGPHVRPLFPPEDMQRIAHGERVLWVLAYQDYIDWSGIRHRAGYCRRYVPSLTQNNLVFVDRPGYNYDIEIDEQGNPTQ
jgi:hypothetical protein